MACHYVLFEMTKIERIDKETKRKKRKQYRIETTAAAAKAIVNMKEQNIKMKTKCFEIDKELQNR